MNRIVGALWEREKKGMKYYSGVLRDFRGDIRIAVFPNDFKKKENHPDMNIVISFGNENNANGKSEKSEVGSSKKDDDDEEKAGDDDDDVPF